MLTHVPYARLTDLASAAKCVDVESYRGFTPGWAGACASLDPIWKAIPDLHVELLDVAEGDGFALVRGAVSGTAAGRLYGTPATR